MRDGIKIALSYYLPEAKTGAERFPVLFELLPYRKDDLFAMRDYSLYSYFAERGYAIAKADVRGTGSSEGAIPGREYSEEEIQDALEIIDRLSKKEWSNGNVGMWGISWSGFNAIQTAMRRPPALKAILAVDATDDLYKDDVHYIDGAFHVDEYALSVENDNILPASPQYRIDEDYLKNRFERYPWFLTYKKQQTDGPFWRGNSLRWRYDEINIPVYLIGALLDGYRDSVPRMLENLKVPVKAVIGPWNHAWPDDGVPGPNHEWREEIIRWWDHWLKGKDTGLLKEPRLAVFVREGDPPDAGLKTASGRWRFEDWPIARARWTPFYLDGDRRLSDRPRETAVHKLFYKPGAGTAAGYWWGEATGDMAADDASSLVYDGPELKENVEIIGMPRLKLKVAADAKLAHWTVRLEDVFPDGRVALVAGAVLNGSQRRSRLNPAYLEPDRIYDLAMDLHFTTWVFKPGHRIRVAVSNAQFPMIWPTPYPMVTRLYAGTGSFIELPVIPLEDRPVPPYLPPRPRTESPYGKYINDAWPKIYRLSRDLEKSKVSVEWEGEESFELEKRRYSFFEKTLYYTHDTRPADSGFKGEAGHNLELEDRRISTRVFVDVYSTETDFRIQLKRQIFENGKLLHEKLFDEAIPRLFQ